MLQVLNRHEKEELVVRMHQDGKTMRDIASTVYMSFGDIGKIIKRIDGEDNDINLSYKSKATQALYLFETRKTPIEIAIELDISYSEVIDLQQEYWALKELYDLLLVYEELKHDYDSFFEMFKLFKKNRMLRKQHISKILRYADYDLPSLENKIRKLINDVIELEFRKKDLKNTIILQRAQLSDPGQTIIRYQNAIEYKQQQ